MEFPLHGRHFLKETDFTVEEWLYLLDLAAELKAAKKAGREVNGRRRLTDTPLLVRDGNDARVLGARERRAFEHGQIAHVALDLIRQRGVVGTHETPS